MEPVSNTQPLGKNKFGDKKKIIWSILAIIAIVVVVVVLIQKYRIQKTTDTQAEKEKQIFMELSRLSKNTNDDPKVNAPILKELSEISKAKGGDTVPPEKQADIFKSLKSLSQ